MKDEALDLALEVMQIKSTLSAFGPDEGVTFTQDTWAKLHAAMSAVVAQQAPVQEPVAIDADMRNVLHGALVRSGKVISPPAAQRQWVGLPFGEICEAEVIATDEHNNFSLLTFARAIEAKLKEKNT
jgi:hypothetical protein